MAMMTVELVPLVGAGEIRFGTARKAVHSLLGSPETSFMKTPDSIHPTDAWSQACFQVFYATAASASEPVVEYIEVSKGASIEAACFGLPVFRTPAEQLIAQVSKHAPSESDDGGYSYVFPRLELAFWRALAEDCFFATVGTGTSGYYSAKQEI